MNLFVITMLMTYIRFMQYFIFLMQNDSLFAQILFHIYLNRNLSLMRWCGPPVAAICSPRRGLYRRNYRILSFVIDITVLLNDSSWKAIGKRYVARLRGQIFNNFCFNFVVNGGGATIYPP